MSGRRARLQLPFIQWPSADRLLWQQAISNDDPFSDGSRAVRLAKASLDRYLLAWRRFLGFLTIEEPAALDIVPAKRLSSERVRAFTAHLRHTNNPRSTADLIDALYQATRLMMPSQDWTWLRTLKSRLLAATPRPRAKGAVITSLQLLEAGERMMKHCELEPNVPISLDAAIRYRDGFMLAFLAFVPLRPKNLRALDIGRVRTRFADGMDTPRAYLERCIERIDALEPAVMAFAFLNLERAREAADECGARYRAGRPLSPVDGMPVGIKDLIETYDMPTEFGSELFRSYQPLTDAATVRALRQGGAVLVGKTVTVCFGGGDPARTRNPFDTRRTPGGSSSGTAAAVASAMLPAALGTHARGSTIRPASFCGAYALKPTFGAINRQGSFSMAYSMDHIGVFAGTLSDMWTTARYMASEAGDRAEIRFDRALLRE